MHIFRQCREGDKRTFAYSRCVFSNKYTIYMCVKLHSVTHCRIAASLVKHPGRGSTRMVCADDISACNRSTSVEQTYMHCVPDLARRVTNYSLNTASPLVSCSVT